MDTDPVVPVFRYDPEAEMTVNTWPDTPLPAGTRVYNDKGEQIATLGPPLPNTDGTWRNYFIPNPFTDDDPGIPDAVG